MRCYLFTLSLALTAPGALAAQRAEPARSGVSRLPMAYHEVDLSTALAQQRAAGRQQGCSRSFMTNMADGAIGKVIMLPVYALMRVAYKGLLPQVKPAFAAATGAAAWSVVGIRETIRCRRQTAGRR